MENMVVEEERKIAKEWPRGDEIECTGGGIQFLQRAQTVNAQ